MYIVEDNGDERLDLGQYSGAGKRDKNSEGIITAIRMNKDQEKRYCRDYREELIAKGKIVPATPEEFIIISNKL